MRRTEYWSELVQNVTFAFRHFVAQPALTIVALLTLAIGIGATTAIFSAMHAVVLQPLPLPAPERLVNLYEDYRGRPGSVSAGNYTDARPRPRRSTASRPSSIPASTSRARMQRSVSPAPASPPASSTCSG
jgi:hypothetical protein